MPELALLLLTLLWGTTFTLVKGVLAVASPGVFLAARFGIATLVLALAWMMGRWRRSPALFRHGVLLGLAMLGGFVLQTLGLGRTTPSRSGFITGLGALAVPFIARFFMGRPVRTPYWIGTALAVSGLFALTRPFGEGIDAAVRLGDLLTFGCAIAFALQIVFTAEWAPRQPLVPFVTVQVATTFVGSLAWIAIEGPRLDPAGLAQFGGVVAFTGVAMTALAFFVMNWGQRHTTAVRAALIFSLEPLAAAVFSHWYGGEPLGLADWMGGGLIVLGVVVGEVGGALDERARATAETAV